MPSRGAATTVAKPMRLPPLPKLRVRRPNQAEKNRCMGLMTSVLACWASSGHSIQGCAAVEQQLRLCMDAKPPPPKKKNPINYHLARLYPNIVGPTKKGK